VDDEDVVDNEDCRSGWSMLMRELMHIMLLLSFGGWSQGQGMNLSLIFTITTYSYSITQAFWSAIHFHYLFFSYLQWLHWIHTHTFSRFQNSYWKRITFHGANRFHYDQYPHFGLPITAQPWCWKHFIFQHWPNTLFTLTCKRIAFLWIPLLVNWRRRIWFSFTPIALSLRRVP
jgi:hypothetical protein